MRDLHFGWNVVAMQVIQKLSWSCVGAVCNPKLHEVFSTERAPLINNDVLFTSLNLPLNHLACLYYVLCPPFIFYPLHLRALQKITLI